MLSERQQVTRIRQLAGRALGAYPLADPQLRLIAHQENTTFRVDATAAGSVMARLHNHAAQWDVPPGFVWIRWDAETFFGDTMVYGGINAAAAARRPGPSR